MVMTRPIPEILPSPVSDRSLLEVRNLDVSYGAIRALHGVSLDVRAGEIVTLIGANGAGKTTLLRTISGLLKPLHGTIEWIDDGRDDGRPVGLHRLKPDEIVRHGVIQVPEGRQVFANLSVRDNLHLGAHQRRDKPAVAADIEQAYERFPILRERKTQSAGTLSGGEQQMLAIARALMGRPKLLLLDEPSLGLAPLIVRRIFEIIREINQTGTTVFLVEQNAHMALSIAHRAYVLQSGQVVKSDLAKNLLADDEVRKAYLGG
jgi:branched-chain amino acid transport system ATP-binding protein